MSRFWLCFGDLICIFWSIFDAFLFRSHSSTNYLSSCMESFLFGFWTSIFITCTACYKIYCGFLSFAFSIKLFSFVTSSKCEFWICWSWFWNSEWIFSNFLLIGFSFNLKIDVWSNSMSFFSYFWVISASFWL